MPRPITELTKRELNALENNYQRLNQTAGGIYSLVEVRRELQRREGGNFDGKTVFETILKLARQSDTGFITYGQLFKCLHKVDWVGNGSQQKLNKDLGAVVYYCVQNKLPIVTSLIIRQNNNQLTNQAKQNIYDCAKQLGVTNMQANVELYISEQQEKSLNLARCDGALVW